MLEGWQCGVGENACGMLFGQCIEKAASIVEFWLTGELGEWVCGSDSET